MKVELDRVREIVESYLCEPEKSIMEYELNKLESEVSNQAVGYDAKILYNLEEQPKFKEPIPEHLKRRWDDGSSFEELFTHKDQSKPNGVPIELIEMSAKSAEHKMYLHTYRAAMTEFNGVNVFQIFQYISDIKEGIEMGGLIHIKTELWNEG